MHTTSLREFIKSRQFTAVIVTVAALAVIAGSFSAGMAVGYHKARNSYAWSENYSRVFAGPRGGFMRDIEGRDFIESSGTFGAIIKLDGSTLYVSGRDGAEKAVVVGPGTTVRRFHDDIPVTQLQVGDPVVVVGSSDGQGRIQAELIRVMPPPPASATAPQLH